MYPDDRLLRRALTANVAFSSLSAGVLLVGADPLAQAMGLESSVVLLVVAGMLALFAVDLVRQIRVRPLHPTKAAGAAVADLAWAVGSAILLAGWSGDLSPTGVALIALVALVVLGLALAQLAGLTRYSRNRRSETNETSMHELTRTLEAPADGVWALLSDLERIGDFYTELDSVRVETRDGSTVRTCVDRGGNRWSEEVLRKDDSTRDLAVRLVTEADDFPFPMTSMVGGWQVEPRGRQCDVTLWYEYTMRGGILGEIMAALSAPLLDRRMGPVLEALGSRARGVPYPAAAASSASPR